MILQDKEMVLYRRQPRRWEGRMSILNIINIELPLPLLPNVGRTLRDILRPQRTTTNSCICPLEEANRFPVKPEMICLLPKYQGFDSENPYSYMREFEDVCSAFLSTSSPLHIICLILFPFSLKEKAKIWFHSLTPNSISNWEDM